MYIIRTLKFIQTHLITHICLTESRVFSFQMRSFNVHIENVAQCFTYYDCKKVRTHFSAQLSRSADACQRVARFASVTKSLHPFATLRAIDTKWSHDQRVRAATESASPSRRQSLIHLLTRISDSAGTNAVAKRGSWSGTGRGWTVRTSSSTEWSRSTYACP